MAGTFKATTGELAQFASKIDHVQAQINGQIQQLQTVVDEVTSQWKGAAATAYDLLQAQVNQHAKDINVVLDTIGQRISQTGTQYQTTEDDQQQTISAITAALG